MKKNLITAVAVLSMVTFIYSCKKDKAELDAETKQFNDDSNLYKNESDQADDDINNQLRDISVFGKGVGVTLPAIMSSPLCGATIDSSQLLQKILFFNFDGVTPCFSPSRTRSGQIKVELISGNYWSDAGAILRLTYTNFKVTRLSDNKSIQFNGVKTLTNINGNDWLGFLLGTASLKYKERALNIQVLFDNGAQATWNSARITQWSYTPSNQRVNFTANGDTILNGFSTVDSWGVNRYSHNFTTYYTSPWQSNSYCGYWRPVSGEFVHNVNANDFRFTLGVDQGGNPSTLDCAYGFKVTWTNGGNTSSVVLSY
jgi:hypothetical protein